MDQQLERQRIKLGMVGWAVRPSEPCRSKTSTVQGACRNFFWPTFGFVRQLAASLVETHGVELGRRHDLAHLDLEGVEVSGKELVALLLDAEDLVRVGDGQDEVAVGRLDRSDVLVPVEDQMQAQG